MEISAPRILSIQEKLGAHARIDRSRTSARSEGRYSRIRASMLATLPGEASAAERPARAGEHKQPGATGSAIARGMIAIRSFLCAYPYGWIPPIFPLTPPCLVAFCRPHRTRRTAQAG